MNVFYLIIMKEICGQYDIFVDIDFINNVYIYFMLLKEILRKG